MTHMRRACSLAALVGSAALVACSDGLLRPPAPAGPATVALAASVNLSSGGSSEAYQKVNQLSVRFLAGGTQRLSQIVPFDPGASQTVIPLQVPLEDVTESFAIELSLLAGSQPLFQGSGTVQLSAGGTSQVAVPIEPVVSGVTCAGPPFHVAVYNAARGPMTAAALFATGDTAPNVAIDWSSSNPAIATINQVDGVVRGLQDGTATATCSARGFSSTREIQVFAVVATVQVQPSLDTVAIGAQATFTATLLDSLGHVISAPRNVNWTSGNPAIAVVTADGRAIGVTTGTTTISATSAGASGSANLVVAFPAPLVTTAAATAVGAAAATLNGTANTQGPTALAWFEWGTAADLAGAATTSPQQLSAGGAAQAFSHQLGNLLGNQTYYYRAVASSVGGTSRGSILSFTTRTPPTVRTISGTPVLSGVSLTGGVNPQGLATQAWFEWSTSPSLSNLQQTAPQNLTAGNRSELPISASLANLTPGVTYYFRAAASNSIGTSHGQILSVRTNGPPLTTTLPATLNGATATLAGAVNPGGLSTSAWFEWSTSPFLTGAISTPSQNIGSGSADVAVSDALTGLAPGITYYYRVAASNQFGTNRGTILSFTSPRPPTSATLSPTGIGTNAATLQGTVNPNGAATSAWFEWGVGPAPNVFASTTPQALGAGTATLAVSQFLPGLAIGTTYTFRIAASNALGTTRGAAFTFNTAGSPTVRGDGSDWVYSPADTAWIVDLFGTVTPNGASTQAWFEIAADPSFSNLVAVTSRINVGAGFGEVHYTGSFEVPYCNYYYYRAVAANSFGVSYGTPRSTDCEGLGLPLPE